MSDYRHKKTTTVMVPVKVVYHDRTKVISSFFQPSSDDVSEALKNNHFTQEDLEDAKKLIAKATELYEFRSNESNPMYSMYLLLCKAGSKLGMVW